MDKLPRDLRFKLERIAFNHKVPVRGYSVFEIIRKIVETGNNLNESEKELLTKVGKFFGEDVSEFWRKK